MIRFDHHAQFITVTNLNWLPVLQNEYHKNILLEALKHRVDLQQLTVYAFVIMHNHFHVIWQIHDGIQKEIFQRDFLKFTARSILRFMKMNDDPLLKQLKVNTRDRMYQVWERNSLSIDLHSENFFLQKINYIHYNPIKKGYCQFPEQYPYSSADFYLTGNNTFDWLTHFRE
jgi:REP element-mobilizing transposase RayT